MEGDLGRGAKIITKGNTQVIKGSKGYTVSHLTTPSPFPYISGPGCQTLDRAIHRINHYPVSGSNNKQLHAIYRIVIYPVDSIIHLLNN